MPGVMFPAFAYIPSPGYLGCDPVGGSTIWSTNLRIVY